MTRESKLDQQNPKVTVVYPQDATEATVKITGGQGSEPITKKLSFQKQGDGQQQPGQGGGQQPQKPDQGQQPQQPQQPPEDENENQIQVQATQDPKDPHLITLKATQFPPNTDKLIIDWGVQQVGSTPKELTKEKPQVSVKFSEKTKRLTITVDDENNPKTKPWAKAFKIDPNAGPAQGQQPNQGQQPQQGSGDGSQPVGSGSTGGSQGSGSSGSGSSGSGGEKQPGKGMSDQNSGGQSGSGQGQPSGGSQGGQGSSGQQGSKQ